MLRIGVDGGATTTRAVVVDDNLQVLGRGEAPSSNHYSVGLQRATRNLQRAAAAALHEARVPPEAIAGWGFGLAGACTATEQTMLRDYFKAQLRPLLLDKPLVVDEDAAAAQVGAFDGAAGVVCIAGTGANCFGVNDYGERARADGLGPLLGDRGSGYWIGEATLRAICGASEGTGPSTPLLPVVLEALRAHSVEHLVQLVYEPDFQKDRIAALFPIVLQCAVAGDDVAHSILRAAGRQLAVTARVVLERLCLTRLAVSGGVLNRDTPVREAFEEALRMGMPHAQIQEPRHDATMGAALLTRAGVKATSRPLPVAEAVPAPSAPDAPEDMDAILLKSSLQA